MKNLFARLAFATALTSLSFSIQPVLAQGTAFTYQGQLQNNGSPANGIYDLTFTLYNAGSGGTPLGGPLTNAATGVTNGLFTTSLEFGPGVFNGASYWLEIGVRTNGGASFATLAPRQTVTPAPYSIFAENSSGVNNGSISAPQLNAGTPASGQVLEYNGSSLQWTNLSNGSSGWNLTGNSGTLPGTDFLGTTDFEPLELWVNDGRAFRLEPGNGSPNVIGGSSSSADTSVGGGTIAGGIQNTLSNNYPTVGGGEYNHATANGAVVGGGYNNTASGRFSTVSGGVQGNASGIGAFIGGGGYDGTTQSGNGAGGVAATVSGGLDNNASGSYATVSGGAYNQSSTAYDTVPGGSYNVASGGNSFAAGHQAQALHNGAFVWADATGGAFQSTTPDQFSVRADGGVRFVTSGGGMTLDGYQVLTTASGGGGSGGIFTNGWSLSGNSGTDPSVNFLGTVDGAGLVLRVNNLQGLRLDYVSAGPSGPNNATDESMNMSGGFWANSISSGVLGATIAGGGDLHFDTVSGLASYPNAVTGNFGTVGGGSLNTAGVSATVPGGYNNSATGNGSFAAGRSAQTAYDGNFVWSDGTAAFNGTGANCFDVLASGGVILCDGGTPTASAEFKVQTTRAGSAENTATFYAPNIGPNKSHIHYGTTGDWYIRSANSSGKIVLQDSGGLVGIGTATPREPLDVNGGFVEVQGNGAQAAIGGLSASQGVIVGSFNPGVTAVSFQNMNTLAPMHINCSSITIQGGADLAEPFQITTADKEIALGAVLVIDEENPGHLKLSEMPYDTRVAGVVSGANGIHPGIQMQQQGLLEGGKNVALTGRVYVQADTSNGAIRPGDLLTTSTVPGRAMKVSDHARASGAILGKAMTALKQDRGMVLVLVTLQ